MIFLAVQSDTQKSSTIRNSPSLRHGMSGVKAIIWNRTNVSVPRGWRLSERRNRMPSDWSFVSLDIELTNQCSSECLMSQREGITRPKGVMSRKSYRRFWNKRGVSVDMSACHGQGGNLKEQDILKDSMPFPVCQQCDDPFRRCAPPQGTPPKNRKGRIRFFRSINRNSLSG